MKRLQILPDAKTHSRSGWYTLPLLAAVAFFGATSATPVWAQNRNRTPEPSIAFDENEEQDDAPLEPAPRATSRPELTPREELREETSAPETISRGTATRETTTGEEPLPQRPPRRDQGGPNYYRQQPANSYEEPDGEDDEGGCDDGQCYNPGRQFRFNSDCNPMANRLEARGEWLLWWGAGDHVPALVTTSPATTPRAQAGILGQAGTSVLFGDTGLNIDATSGMRFTIDYWLTCDHTVGLELQYFGMSQNSQSFQGDSSAFPVLARPFFNTTTTAADAGLIAYPNVQTGNLSVNATTDLQGAEAIIRHALYRVNDAHIDFLAGYRYVRLSDNLDFAENETFIDPRGVVPVNSTLALTDHFGTVNEFNGADFGFASDWKCGRLNFGMTMKVGVGNTNSKVNINGGTTATEPGQAALVSSGGLLAQNSNIGSYSHNQFTMLPELGVNVGFDLTKHVRLMGGYSLLYWGSVARAGDQIDTNLGQTQFPPPQTVNSPFPQFRFAASEYWAQGINLGLDLHF